MGQFVTIPNDPINRAPAEVAYTVRDLVLQVSGQVSSMQAEFERFKSTVVTKAEFDLFQETQRTTRRWSVGIILSIVGVGSATTTLVTSLMM